MNRFSGDIQLLDHSMILRYGFVAILLYETFNQAGIIFITLPVLVPCIIPLLILLFFVTVSWHSDSCESI